MKDRMKSFICEQCRNPKLSNAFKYGVYFANHAYNPCIIHRIFLDSRVLQALVRCPGSEGPLVGPHSMLGLWGLGTFRKPQMPREFARDLVKFTSWSLFGPLLDLIGLSIQPGLWTHEVLKRGSCWGPGYSCVSASQVPGRGREPGNMPLERFWTPPNEGELTEPLNSGIFFVFLYVR